MAKRKKPEPEADYMLVIPVTYGDVGIGDETARIGVSVERKWLPLGKADQHLTNKRLIGAITAVPGSDNPDQQQLISDEAIVRAAFDVKGFRVTRKFITFGVTFALASVDVELLSHFAKRSGHFKVEEFTDIPKPEKAAAPAGGGGEDAGDGDPDGE